ncbi:MAG: AEC family transporter [Candidatus Cloacimonas sp.]|nr:AEC family transporter [Candidatus Cloacimonadota bacterium]
MADFLLQVVPIILLFVVGIILSRLKVLAKSDGDTLLKMSLYLSIPASVLLSMQRVVLEFQLFYLPLAAGVVVFSTYFIAKLFTRWVKMESKQEGTFLLGCMIMNTAFMLPFSLAAYDQEGFIRSALFDVGNVFLIFTFIYYIAIRYGGVKGSNTSVWKKMATLPPLWALIVGLILNLTKAKVPIAINNTLQFLANMTTPLVMVALGVYFQPRVHNVKKISLVYLIRIIGGLLSGLLFIAVFKVTGLNAKIIIASAAAPVGYNTLVLSQMEELDVEFAASLVSFSILLGIIYIPILILLMW